MLILYSHQTTLMFLLCFILLWMFISFYPLWPSQLILWQHRYTLNTAFISSFTQSVPASICVLVCDYVCVCVWIRTSEKQRASGMQSNIFTMRNSFEDNSSLLPRCDDCFLYELSEKNSKLIFKCHHMCLWLTVIDAIYGCVWDMQYRVELNWKQHVIAGTMG